MIEMISICDEKIAKQLEEIENTIFSTSWPSETIMYKINNRDFKYWTYKKNEEMIAYVGVQFVNDFIEILGIGVIQKYRQRGIAKELMNELMEFFNQSSYLKILLEVRESNVKAQNLYTHFGFNKISKRKNYYNNEDADVYLKEKINV
tara:strand:+ start:6817 stop:7260 length:444 start_codon:yes stop_codon:yes gene_type:complete